MSAGQRCPRCNAELPADAVVGLCPRCLMIGAMQPTQDGDPVRVMPAPAPGEIAAHFPQLEIIELLGRGGMGVVYKARQKALGRLVALKLLAPERVADVKFAERFTHEAKALAALSHPNIVTIHDFGQAGGFYYLIMEFVDGVNLREAMRAGRFTPEQALAIVPPVCEALQFAHERGIVHWDVKPENLLLDKDGRVKIADFGIAKMLDQDAVLPPPDQGEPVGAGETMASAAGTPQYMAPEQKEQRRTDHRADIYSLGVVLYELLTGELPADKLQPPSRKVQIDVRLDEIVLRALERKPELRYQTAGEFRTQVETLAAPVDRREAKAESASPPLAAASPAPESRFSRTAIVGACWVIFFFAVVPAFLVHEVQTHEFWRLGPFVSPLMAFVWFVFIIPAFIAPLGVTLLGYIATTQIRRSAGRLHGLGLAVFDGLFFPLLVLDALIVLMARKGWAHPTMAVQGAPKLAIVLLLAMIVVVDILIIRAVWRMVKPPATNGSAPGEAGAALFCVILSAFLGCSIWLRMLEDSPVLVFSILGLALLGIGLAIPVRKHPRGMQALVSGCISVAIWLMVALASWGSGKSPDAANRSLMEAGLSGGGIDFHAENQKVAIKTHLDGQQELRVFVGEESLGWSVYESTAGPITATVEASSEIRLDDGSLGKGFIFRAGASTFRVAITPGGPVPFGELVFRESRNITVHVPADSTEGGTCTFADIRQPDGALVPVSIAVRRKDQPGGDTQSATDAIFGLRAERMLSAADANADGVIGFRFGNNDPVKPPVTVTGHFKDLARRGFTPELKQWIHDEKVDLLVYLGDKQFDVLTLDMRDGFAGQPTEWDTIRPDRAAPVLARLEALNTKPGPGIAFGTGYRDGLSSVNVFRTRDGLVGYYQLRGVEDLTGRGVNIRYKLLVPETATPGIALADPPQLRFVGWQDQNTEMMNWRAWHPDGTAVLEKDELRVMNRAHPELMDVTGTSEGKKNPRFLFLWFAHPAIDNDSYSSVTLLDAEGQPLAVGGAGSIGFKAFAGDPATGDLGWITYTISPGNAGFIPAAVTVRLACGLGPWEIGKEIPTNYSGAMMLGNRAMLGSIGQNADGNAFISFARSDGEAPDAQYDFLAIQRDGSEVKQTSIGRSGQLNVQTEIFRFPVKLEQLKGFRLRKRPIKTVEFKDVPLPQSAPEASASAQ